MTPGKIRGMRAQQFFAAEDVSDVGISKTQINAISDS
jgi:hypothetical protein